MAGLWRMGTVKPHTKSVVDAIALKARDTFRCRYGTSEYEAGVTELVSMLSALKPQDVSAAPSPSHPPVSYASMCHHHLFTMGMFYLKQGENIPLHDHPGMTVISRVMYGQVRIRSLDWATEDVRVPPLRAAPLKEFDPPLRKVLVGSDQRMSGTDGINTRVLFPVRGNVHAIHALTDCCFLDILAPPYAQGERDCHYYREYAAAEIDGGDAPMVTADGREVRYVAETDAADFYCGHAPYTGPPVRIPP